MKTVAIIGAGISGITLANLLDKKVKCSIFDKSKGVGGRMATRRAEPFQFNHGAQYFKVENKQFKHLLKPLIKNKILQPWKSNHIEVQNKAVIKRVKINNNKYYCGNTKMNSIVKYLARNNFSIKLSCKIQKVKKIKSKWYIYDTENTSYGPYDWIIFTTPPNQATEILCKDFKYSDIIQKIKMRSCFTLMLGYKKIKKFDFDTALILDEDIKWVSIKNIYQEKKLYFNLLINSSYSFAEKNINSSRDIMFNYLLRKTSDILNIELDNYEHKDIHFWKYAMAEKKNNFGSFLDDRLRIIVCGDWCMNGRVEGAFLSASNAVSKLLKFI